MAVLSLVLATFLGALGAIAKLSGGMLPTGVAGIYTTIVRGVPDLVLILLIYFGGQRLVNDIGRGLDLDYIEVSKFWSGVVSIGFIYGAYLTETFRGAYLSVPKGQPEAAYALGLNRGQTLRLVTLPQLLRHALPGYGNVWMVLVKSTAVVSVIGLEDLVGLADKAGKSTREPFLFFTAVILVYLAITAASNWGLRQVDRRVSKGITA
ncbi:ABC transporter permease subunit [Limibaculum sp. M0105]|uniref:ABC transporter permease subunit n=1 Tax=Thermohalobaculum xanthum TaxID=2753746 RepID=A0A8J7M8R6_9RHOB|nr:ABC transporter permease subunit [Thermohalobaculum xanthum]